MERVSEEGDVSVYMIYMFERLRACSVKGVCGGKVMRTFTQPRHTNGGGKNRRVQDNHHRQEINAHVSLFSIKYTTCDADGGRIIRKAPLQGGASIVVDGRIGKGFVTHFVPISFAARFEGVLGCANAKF